MNQDQMEMTEDCVLRESRMSEWEMDFVSDMNDILLAGRNLTPNQSRKLNEIWEKVTERG